jgi:hypothetical protein
LIPSLARISHIRRTIRFIGFTRIGDTIVKIDARLGTNAEGVCGPAFYRPPTPSALQPRENVLDSTVT